MIAEALKKEDAKQPAAEKGRGHNATTAEAAATAAAATEVRSQ